MDAETDTLFLACTRPAMWAGIPIQACGALLISWGVIFEMSGLFSHSVWRLVWCGMFLVVGYGVCRALTAIDHNIFGVLFLWTSTKGRASRNQPYWGGSSSSPVPLRTPRKASEVIVYE